jgi:uncharacterized protein YggE
MSSQKSVLNRLGAVAVVLALVVVSAQAALAPVVALAQAPEGTITVVGEGRVKIKPDTAQASIGVEVVKPTVKEASAEASNLMNSVIEVLKQKSIEDKDIQTSSFSVWLERPYNQDGTQGDPVYHVSNQVNVTIHQLDRVGDLLDATMVAGANNIYGVTFSLSDTTKVEAEARRKAVEHARIKAQDLAQLAGLALGEVISVSEVIGSTGGSYFPGMAQQAAVGMGGGGGGPISPGELEITMQVQLVYGTVQ